MLPLPVIFCTVAFSEVVDTSPWGGGGNPKPFYYYLYLDETHEIEMHKWLESEKAGRDVGMDWARLDWLLHHRSGWLASWLRERKWEKTCH